MSERQPATAEISLPKVLRDELNHIKSRFAPEKAATGKSSESLNEVFADLHRAELSALCFSGGGIRSATFGLGIVQALAKYRLLDKFDYLSTVSGGGYLGAWLSAWIRRMQMGEFEITLAFVRKNLDRAKSKKYGKKILDRQITGKRDAEKSGKIARLNKKLAALNLKLYKDYQTIQTVGINAVQDELNRHATAEADCPNIEPKQLQYLREYSNYMSPKVGLLSADTWTFLGIYTRNLFLNWTIFVPLICAILLIPRILLALTNFNFRSDGLPATISERYLYLMLFCSLVSGIVAVFSIVRKLPSKYPDRSAVKYNTDGGVFFTVIVPLLLMAWAATTFWAWLNISKITPATALDQFRPFFRYEIVNFIVFSSVIFVAGNALFYLYKTVFPGKVNIKAGELFAAFLASAVGGVLSWLIARNFFDADFFSDVNSHPHRLPVYICLAVPLHLLCFSVSSAVFAGLYSRVATDSDREWLARQSAWVLIVCGAWILLNAIVLFGPIGLVELNAAIFKLFSHDSAVRPTDYFSPLVPIIAAISGFISLFGGFSGKSKVKDEPETSKLSRFLAVAPKIAAVIFLTFIFIGLAYASIVVIVLIGGYFEIPFDKSADWMLTGKSLSNALYESSVGYLLVWLIGLTVVGIVMACFINVNKFSLHAAYRDRLIRAYLGASHVRRGGSTFTGFDDSDNFQLHRLKGQKPFHVINATLNLVAGKNLAWQNRRAASFTMSPLHCGSWLLGYRRTNEYCRNTNLPNCEHLRFCNKTGEPCRSVTGDDCELKGKALRLGTAMTISGAAANPNMGYYSSPVVTFLMSLFNIRLGWWLGNTGAVGDRKDIFGERFFTKPSPSNAVLPLLNETLGRTDEHKRFLNVTDGGHFENLGLYEMILRRCKLIVLSDAAADDAFTFGELANAVEKCKVDLGVDIKFADGINIYSRHIEREPSHPKKRFAVAEIIYPEKNRKGENYKGCLLYIRPTFYGSESAEIKHYAEANATFPHQSTADQLYDEKQFEAYRALGFHIAEEIIKHSPAEVIKTKSAGALFKLLANSADGAFRK